MDIRQFSEGETGATVIMARGDVGGEVNIGEQKMSVGRVAISTINKNCIGMEERIIQQ
jgi:hypothetical protein